MTWIIISFVLGLTLGIVATIAMLKGRFDAYAKASGIFAELILNADKLICEIDNVKAEYDALVETKQNTGCVKVHQLVDGKIKPHEGDCEYRKVEED